MATQLSHPLLHRVRTDDRTFWIGVAILATTLAAIAYVATHHQPAFEGGLYLQIVKEIRAGGYALPMRIDYYTPGGIPFAYPPLLFYVTAVIVDVTHVDPVQLMVVLPGLFVLAYLIPYYFVAEELLGDATRAGFATVFFGVAPPVLRWHLSAGGIVRAPAMLVVLVGLYSGLRLYRTGERRWLLASTICWSLIVVIHPVYAAFFGGSFLLLYLRFDRTVRGLLQGATVAITGVVVTSPWWITIVERHGVGVFLTASHSRAKLGNGIPAFVHHFTWPFMPIDAISPFFALVFAALVYGLYRRRVFLVTWVGAGIYLLGQWRFTFVAGSMLAAILVFDGILPIVRRAGRQVGSGRGVATAAVALLVLSSTGLGVAFAASDLHAAHVSSPTMPQTVDAQDRAAYAWARTHTDPSARFLVMADAAEWFPYYTDRTILISPWGTEWTPSYPNQLHAYLVASSCQDLACLENSAAWVKGRPNYVWVPNHSYTVEGEVHPPPKPLIRALRTSPDYRLRYANDGVVIFEVKPSAPTTRRSFTPHRTSETGG